MEGGCSELQGRPGSTLALKKIKTLNLKFGLLVFSLMKEVMKSVHNHP